MNRAALISIRPEYAFGILSGKKLVEFRRRRVGQQITHLALYVTKPIRAVMGVVEVSQLVSGSPRVIWELFGQVGGIDETDFVRYFEGAEKAHAYKIGRVFGTNCPVALGHYGLPERPPQSFQYLSAQTFDWVRSEMSENHEYFRFKSGPKDVFKKIGEQLNEKGIVLNPDELWVDRKED